MTCVTRKSGNRHTTRHHQRETSALESARQNRYTDPLHTASAERGHTLGTALINRDVPQHVVQKILDHDSPLMTAHYARLSDKTVREHWEKARKVGATGQPVQISPDGPLGDAAWAKHQLSRATQALPTGTASCHWSKPARTPTRA